MGNSVPLAAMSGFFVDVTPLRRSRDYRRLLTANTVLSITAQLSVVAISYEVYRVTRSDLDVGLISLAQLIPALFGSIFGGAIADAMDRRKVLLFTATGLAAVSTGLAINLYQQHPQLFFFYLLAAIAAIFQGVNAPTWTALLVATVERDLVVQANALRLLSNRMSTVLGPTVAGVLIASFSVKTVFWVNVGAILIAIATVLCAQARPSPSGTTRFGWTSIVEGFSYLKGHQAIQGCFIADLNATILGMPTALFPALAITHFHGGPRLVGLLYAAPGIGALLSAGTSGWTASIRRPGYGACMGAVFWGLAIAAFGLVSWVPLAVFCLVIAGGADMLTSIFRGAIVQLEVPDRLRGRVSAIQSAVVSSGPRLGNTEAGLVAALTNTQFSVVSGGIGCVIGIALIAKLMPSFVHYVHASEDEQTATTR